MIFFQLPNVHYKIYEYLDYIVSETKPTPFISQSLSYYLYHMKYKIDKHEKDWDNYKKYTNPYEYINTVPPNKSKCVSKYKPLSRSYYKMVEIIDSFKLLNIRDNIKTFHLAEGPGGFIEAIVNKRKNPNDKYIGITLLDDVNDINIPSWKKSQEFLHNNPNVFIENGKDKTGNILSIENFEYCVEKYGSSMNILTGDGGFDFSMDFNNQEMSISKLLFAQICYALCLQKENGCFVLKMFDCFMPHSIDLLYLLSCFYETTYICKPQTSRYANSEKYIVCKGFIHSSNKSFYPHLLEIFKIMIIDDGSQPLQRFLNIEISHIFINKLEEYNSIFGQQQIETIHNTIGFIENKTKSEKLENLSRINIQKCISWCSKHNVAHNNFSNTNIFLLNEDDED